MDMMLEEMPKEGDDEATQKAAEVRLATLREDLRKRTDAKASKEPGAILAKRAAAIAEDMDRKKKKKRKAGDALDAIRKAIGSKGPVKEEVDYDGDDVDSGGSEEYSEDEDETRLGEGLGKRASAAGQQKRLRQLSEKRPGKLLSTAFATMHEQVGTHFGDEGKRREKLSPVAVRYLLSFAMPQFSGGISHSRYRELRTLATALDYVVQGRTGQAGDLLAQRFKAILMSIRDGGDSASKWIELLPLDDMPVVASSNEDYMARQMAVHQARSDALLQKAAVS